MDTERHVRHFQDELESLKTRLLEMGGLAEDRVRTGRARARRSGSRHRRARARQRPRHQPAAHRNRPPLLHAAGAASADGRGPCARSSAAVKINTDLERVGDLAINIAEAVARYLLHPPVKELIDIPRMAVIAQDMLRDSLDAFVRRDIALAQSVLDADDKLDTLKTIVFRELLTHMLRDPGTIEPGLDLILISRHLERIGDHATNVAET
jgi:phosphate transport system protein